jgi:hypothetical protein
MRKTDVGGVDRLVRVAALLFTAAHVAAPARGALPCGPTNTTNWCVHQDTSGVLETSGPGDRFGAALAFGDFNDDGYDDLAVGIPGEDGAGAVQVFRGSPTGLLLTGQLLFSQSNLPGDDDGDAEDDDEFGATLAVGDFNEDGIDDLAVAAPGEDLNTPGDGCGLFCPDAGAVHVVYGSSSGLQLGSATFVQARDLHVSNLQRARFGAALAAGNAIATTDADDLVIGAPFADADFSAENGRVYIATGASAGLDTSGGILMTAAADCDGSRMHGGSTLALAHFEPGTRDVLTIGVPDCKIDGHDNTGRAQYRSVFFGAPAPTFEQTDYGSAGNADDDRFAAAMAAGDFDGDDFDDLAIAAPFKDHGSGNPADSGRVYVAYGTADGPDPSDGPDIIGEDEWAASGDAPSIGDLFGTGLAAGRVTGDAFDDLIAGAPGEGVHDVGRVYVKPGGPNGLTAVANTLFTQTALGGQNGNDDHLGTVFAIGDVDGDGQAELALGVPDKDISGDADAGMVYVTRILHLLLDDGFESGSTLAWSTVSP